MMKNKIFALLSIFVLISIARYIGVEKKASAQACVPAPNPTYSATTTRTDGVLITWNNVANETGYIIYRDGAVIGSVGANVTSYLDTNISCGTTHDYSVEASSLCGAGNALTFVPGKCVAPTAPAAPANLSVTCNATTATLKWNSVSSATRYDLFFCTPAATCDLAVDATTTSTSIVKPLNQQTMWRVRACSSAGCSSPTRGPDISCVVTHAISGSIFIDANRNGTRDSGEPAYTGGTSVQASGPSTGSDTTDGAGAFTIPNLPPGTYSVNFTAPSGYIKSGTAPRSVTIANANVTSINFGIAPTYNISGTVFVDTNRNGTKDSGESNYSGSMTVNVTGAQSGSDAISAGVYSVTGLGPGSYSVRITAPSGYVATGTVPRSVTITNANVANIDLGLAPTYTVSGTVFLDTNRNGVKDGSEGSFGNNVTVDINPGGSTNTSGGFTFSELNPATYSVSVTAPTNFRTTNSPRSVIVNNANVTNINLGIAPTYSLSGTVFVDTNRNGTKDAGESNYGSAIQVRLAGTSSGNTNTSGGSYSFSALEPGNYTLAITAPAAFRTTGAIPRAVTITNANVANINLGIALTYTISGSVYVDTNRDGNRDARENNYGTPIQVRLAGTASGNTNTSGGNYSFSALEPGNYTVTITAPAAFRTTTPLPFSVTITNGNISGIDLGLAPTYTITGTVFVDTSRDGVRNGGEITYTLSTLTATLAGASSGTDTTSGGVYSFSDLEPGTYTVRIAVPAGYNATSPNPLTVIVSNANVSVEQAIALVYSISGSVFSDVNKNGVRDASESPYGGGRVTISSPAGNVTVTSGAYIVNDLPPGTYRISYTSPLPGGFVLEYPLNGPPPSFNLTVGPACNVNATRSAVCSARGDITGANYAITNSFPWIQSIGLDTRFDLGYQNVIPASPACGVGSYGTITNGSNTTPGVIFTGDSQASFGNGSSSQTNWVVGGSSYPDSYNTSKTALSVSQSRLLSTFQQTATTIVNVTSYPGCTNRTNCTLPNNLNDPVIRAMGDLTLNSYSFPANTNTILLVTGNLTINGPITVPTSSTAIISAGNNIVVGRDVGVAAACNAGNKVIEGIYIADNDFVVDGYNDCVSHGSDNMLHVNGSVIVNAARGGGIFQNNRELCAQDQQYPSITFTPRLDFLLQVPEIIRDHSFTYQEVAP